MRNVLRPVWRLVGVCWLLSKTGERLNNQEYAGTNVYDKRDDGQKSNYFVEVQLQEPPKWTPYPKENQKSKIKKIHLIYATIQQNSAPEKSRAGNDEGGYSP